MSVLTKYFDSDVADITRQLWTFIYACSSSYFNNFQSVVDDNWSSSISWNVFLCETRARLLFVVFTNSLLILVLHVISLYSYELYLKVPKFMDTKGEKMVVQALYCIWTKIAFWINATHHVHVTEFWTHHNVQQVINWIQLQWFFLNSLQLQQRDFFVDALKNELNALTVWSFTAQQTLTAQ